MSPQRTRRKPDGDLTAEAVRARFAFDENTGVCTWRSNPPRGSVVGGLVHTSACLGYRLIVVRGRTYRAHRLAWLYVYGRWPGPCIDHINGDRADNRMSNLREVSTSWNAQNRRFPNKDSKSGLLGASPTSSGRWQADIRFEGRVVHLGTFDTPEEAHAAYMGAKRFAHPGFVPTHELQEAA